MLLHPSVCIVDVPTRPGDLPKELDLDRHMVASHVRKALSRLLNEVVLRPGAEKLIKDAVNEHLRRLQASGTISNYKVDEASWVSGTQQAFDEVSGLAPGAVPGDPYLEADPATGQPRYGGVVIYSDGAGNGLVFRGHDGLRNTGSNAIKVQVSIQATHSLDYVVIVAETGDPTDPSP